MNKVRPNEDKLQHIKVIGRERQGIYGAMQKRQKPPTGGLPERGLQLFDFREGVLVPATMQAEITVC